MSDPSPLYTSESHFNLVLIESNLPGISGLEGLVKTVITRV